MAHNGGRATVNLYFPYPYYDFWALNACKMQTDPWIVVNGDSNNYNSLIDSDGYPTAMPSGTGAQWRSAQLRIYGVAGETWDLTFPTTWTCTLSGAFNGGSISDISVAAGLPAGHKRYVVTGLPIPTFADGSAQCAYIVTLAITAIGGARGSTEIKLYRTEHQTNIDNGEYFNPDWLDKVAGSNAGMIRFMDWGYTNTNTIVKWAHRSQLSHYSWASSKIVSTAWSGIATKTLNKYTVTSSLTPSHGDLIQFWLPARPTVLTVLSVSAGSPTTLNFTTVHGLTNGDKITVTLGETGGGAWATALTTKSTTTGLEPEYVVTVSDTDTVTIPLNSTGFAAPATLSFMPRVELSNGTWTKRCTRAFVTNFFDSGFTTYYASGGPISAVYHSGFDVMLMQPNFSTTNFNPGIPDEVKISLCNTVSAHPYVTIPYLADDDYINQMTDLYKNTLL